MIENHMSSSNYQSLKPTGLILAAGRGSRMNNVTDTKPKCFIEVKGKRLLDWQVEAMKHAGITDIAVVTGYKSELFSNEEIEKIHNPNWETTDMVFSLACASDWLKKCNCIVSYSDIFFESHAVSSLLDGDEEIAISYDPSWLNMWEQRFEDPKDDAETFKVDNQQFLTEIGGAVTELDEVDGQYMGLIKFTPNGWKTFSNFWKEIEESDFSNVQVTQVLRQLVAKKSGYVKAIPYEGEWGELDLESDLEYYNG